ncbi:MAG: hypothetical protein M1358_03380, partial [Chloroflexi bacterium]|nr:hypothetical protein [Chloroflexota bacterium]
DAGQFSIWMYVSPNWTQLMGWTSSSLINTGSATNRLGIARTGSDVGVYINGYLVATGQNNTTATNVRIGLRAQSGSTAPVASRFDNFSVTGTKAAVLGVNDLGMLHGVYEVPVEGAPSNEERWSAK